MTSVLSRSSRGLAILIAISGLGLLVAPLIVQRSGDTDAAVTSGRAFSDAIGGSVGSDSSGGGFGGSGLGGSGLDGSGPGSSDLDGREPRNTTGAPGRSTEAGATTRSGVGTIRRRGSTDPLALPSNPDGLLRETQAVERLGSDPAVASPAEIDLDPVAASDRSPLGFQNSARPSTAQSDLRDNVAGGGPGASSPRLRAGLAAPRTGDAEVDSDLVAESRVLVGVPSGPVFPDTVPPTAPARVKAQVLSATSVELLWSESLDDNRVALYVVRRDGVEVGRSLTTTFLDDTAAPDTTYSYDVVALDGERNTSPSSPSVQVTTLAAPPDTAEIAAYGFEEGVGSLAEDSTGNGNDGVLAGAARTTGYFGAGVSTDGVSGSVDLGGLDVVGSGLTLAMWCRPAGFGLADGRLISKASGVDADSHVWMLSRINGNQLRFRLRTDAGPTQTLIAGSGALSLGQWSHAAVTYDGAFMRIYLDGVEVGNQAWSGTVAVDPSVNVAVGDQPGGGRNFDGELDEVWIIGRALSPAELAELMTTPIADPAPDTTPPTAPDRVVAYGVSTSRIDLHWTEGQDDDDVAGYRVLRDGAEVGSTTALTFRDTGLVAGTSYAFTILAEDAAGNLSAPTAGATQSTLNNDQDEWFDVSWNYRVPVVVDALGHARMDRLVDLDVDFTAWAGAVGAVGAFDPGSIRVIEVNAAGQILDASVPFQFDADAAYDANTNAVGKLVFVCDGWLPETARRHYHLYFDIDTARTSPTFVDRVSLVDGVIDEGQASYEITTGLGTYLYQKDAGGFSSLLDLDGNDWIDFHPTGGAAGDFRGIPNLSFPEGHFHPGATSSTSSIVRQGPLAIGIHSITNDGWECTWDLYPDHARLTVLATSHPYWFLYEGTPGGVLEPGVDMLVRASGAVVNTQFDDDGDLMGDEWSYFVDPNVGRGLFFANHQDDEVADTWFPLFGLMTVFGFGRDDLASLMTRLPATFTLGFLEDPDFGPASEQVRQFFHDLGLRIGAPVILGGVSPTPTLATSVTATAQSASEVLVSWTEATDNVGIDGYRVLRDGVEIAFVTETSYLDAELQSATTYAYEIIAVDLQGMTSAPSFPVQSTTF